MYCSKNNLNLKSLNDDDVFNQINDLELKEFSLNRNSEIISTKSQDPTDPQVDDTLLNEATKIEIEPETKEISNNNSLFIFKPESKLRQKCIYITSHSWFGHIIFFVIFLNCITLASERPDLKPDSCVSYFCIIDNYQNKVDFYVFLNASSFKISLLI